jgi:hypothetical protein
MAGEENEQEQILLEDEPRTWVEIPASLEVLSWNKWYDWTSVVEIRFASNSRLREIHGFRDCTSLPQIEIPASVEIISSNGFVNCSSLNAIIFASNSRLRELCGFHSCISLPQIEIPASVEIINSFNNCYSLRKAIIPEGSQITEIKGFKNCVLELINIPMSVTTIAFAGRAFLAYSDDRRLMLSRRRFHLCCH